MQFLITIIAVAFLDYHLAEYETDNCHGAKASELCGCTLCIFTCSILDGGVDLWCNECEISAFR